MTILLIYDQLLDTMSQFIAISNVKSDHCYVIFGWEI